MSERLSQRTPGGSRHNRRTRVIEVTRRPATEAEAGLGRKAVELSMEAYEPVRTMAASRIEVIKPAASSPAGSVSYVHARVRWGGVEYPQVADDQHQGMFYHLALKQSWCLTQDQALIWETEKKAAKESGKIAPQPPRRDLDRNELQELIPQLKAQVADGKTVYGAGAASMVDALPAFLSGLLPSTGTENPAAANAS